MTQSLKEYCTKCGGVIIDKILQQLKEAEDCTWITTDSGAHVCIRDGESPEDAINRTFGDKTSKTDVFKIQSAKELDNEKERYFAGNTAQEVSDAYNFKQEAPEVDKEDLQNKLSPMKNGDAAKLANDLSNDDKRAVATQTLSKYLDPQDHKDLVRQIKYEDKINDKLSKVLDKQEFVYRGVSKAELADIQKTGKFNADTKSQYTQGFNFQFATHNPDKATLFGGKDGVILKIDKSSLGNDIKPLKYSFLGFHGDFKTGIYSHNANEFSWNSVAIKQGASAKGIVGVYKK